MDDSLIRIFVDSLMRDDRKAGSIHMQNSKEFRTFEDLECWQACRELRRFAAQACKRLHVSEQHRLKDQILRSARSTTANIAEGYGRFHFQENMQFCRQSRGSAYELLDHFITANDEDLFSDDVVMECRSRTEKAVIVLNGYIRYLEKCKHQ